MLGIDFGHMHVRVAVATTDGKMLATAYAVVDVDGAADQAIAVLRQLVDRVLDDADLHRSTLLGAAAGIPGPLDLDRRVVQSPTILRSWVNRPVGAELEQALGLPVDVYNDADMGAIGEMHFGVARGYRNFIYVKASHGIGASVVINGQLVRGVTGIAGEIGHTRLPESTNRCRCGNQGCLESVISTTEVREQLAHTHLADLRSHMNLTEIATDPIGGKVLTDAGRIVGRVLADGCNWLNPEAIVLGGELGASGEPFADGVRESVARYAQLATAEAVTIHTAQLGELAELSGAIAVARDNSALRSASASLP